MESKCTMYRNFIIDSERNLLLLVKVILYDTKMDFGFSRKHDQITYF